MQKKHLNQCPSLEDKFWHLESNPFAAKFEISNKYKQQYGAR